MTLDELKNHIEDQKEYNRSLRDDPTLCSCESLYAKVFTLKILLGETYRPDISREGLRDQLRALAAMGPSAVVITSAPAARPGNTATVAYDGRRFWQVEVPHMNAFYPGTGDAFASVLTGSLLQGDSLPVAVDRAVHFVYLGIQATYGYDTPHRDGVLLERTLPSLRMPFTGGSYTEF